MEVPLLPNHIYVIYPTEDSTGDKGRVAYAEKMPLGLDSKYPFYSIFEPPVIARASSPGPRNVSTIMKVEQVRKLNLFLNPNQAEAKLGYLSEIYTQLATHLRRK